MAQFRTLIDKTAPAFYVRCSNCKHEFWADSTIEKNLVRVPNRERESKTIIFFWPLSTEIELVEKCPNCGETRD